MALNIRRDPHSLLYALVGAHNSLAASLADNAAANAYPHRDTTSVPVSSDFMAPTATALAVTAAAAVDLPTSITLAENIRSVMQTMMADTLAHKVSDATNLALITLGAAPLSVDQGTVNTVLNALKTAFNAHCSQSGVHSHSDTNTVATANASNLATSEALAIAMKAAVNAHIIFSPGNVLINIVAP